MADEFPRPGEEINWEQFAAQLSAGVEKVHGWDTFWRGSFGPIAELVGVVAGVVLKIALPFLASIVRVIVDAQHVAAPEFAELTDLAIQEVFGKSFGGGGVSAGDPAGAARELGRNLVNSLIAQGGGGGGEGLPPSLAPAQTFIGEIAALPARAWVLSVIPELVLGDRGKQITELVEEMIQGLGLGRLVRQALRPAINTLIAEPATQHFNQTYRPTLLSEGSAIKAFLAGRFNSGELYYELGLKGFSDRRIEALISEQRKFLPLTDANRLVRYGFITQAEFESDAKDQGFTEFDARSISEAFQLERRELLQQRELDAALLELRDGLIDLAQFDLLLNTLHVPADDRITWNEIAQIKSKLPRAQLSVLQLNELLARNLISTGEYRTHLEKRGFSEEDATLLELLQHAIARDREDAARTRAQIKAEKEAAKVQKKADQAAAAAQKKTELAAARKAHQDFILQKQQAASDAAIARIAFTENSITERHKLIDQAQHDKLLTQIQADQARADLQALTLEHNAQTSAHQQTMSALDAEQSAIESSAAAETHAAEQLTQTTKSANARAAVDQEILDAKRADRQAGYELARVSAQAAFDAGELTDKQLQRKLRAIELQEAKDAKAEDVTQLQIERAHQTAEAAVEKGQIAVDQVKARATLAPAASRRRQNAIASTLADHLTTIHDVSSKRTSQLADLATRRIQAADAAAARRDTLDAQIAEQRIALEKQIQAGKPQPPA